MSEKKRQKKDGERKNNKSRNMRDAVSERRQSNSPRNAKGTTTVEEQGRGSTDNPRGRTDRS